MPRKQSEERRKTGAAARNRKDQEETRQKGAAPVERTSRRRTSLRKAPVEKRKSTAWFGAHLSKTDGYFETCRSAREIGADAFALFLGSPRSMAFTAPKEKDGPDMARGMEEFHFTPQQILPHSGYFVNLASPDDAKWEKSITRLQQELAACNQIGLCQLNFHPGSTVGASSREEGIQRVARGMERVLGDENTGNVTMVLEMTAGSKNDAMVGSTLEDMAAIIAAVPEQLRGRVGVCVDTCHCFAAGYDLRTEDTVAHFFREFDRIIGLQYLRGFHINDTKSELGSHLDRHECIGQGLIGIEGFRALARHPAIQGKPLCLETPGFYKEQIALLRKLERGDEIRPSDTRYLRPSKAKAKAKPETKKRR